MRMIIFDDGRHDLSPMTDLRAVFEVRTGVFTNAGRIERVLPYDLAGYWVPERLKDLVAERAAAPVNHEMSFDSVTLINGRWLNPDPSIKLGHDEALADEASGDIIMAAVTGEEAIHFLITGSLTDDVEVMVTDRAVLLTYPFEVIAHRDQSVANDLAHYRLIDALVPDERMMVLGEHPVEIHQTASIYPGVVFDVEHGPVIVDEGAIVRPGAILSGPSYVGPGSVIVDRAQIKANTVIGPVCKVGGEVGGTIFQAYSNKSHDGHLGDSWVGEWVNLGAGTMNSNLLNTYGEVRMRNRREGPVHQTGMTFLGAIIGDHVKTAIGTRLMTGAVVGTGAMLARTLPPPDTVVPFAWMTDQTTQRFRLNKFLDTARAMMARRNREPSEAYIAAIKALHADRNANGG